MKNKKLKIKMKKINLIIGIIFCISLVGAGAIGFNLINAKFTPEPYEEQVRNSGEITFDCGKNHIKLFLDEPNLNIDDDFEEAVRKICDKEVTNVIDWTGRIYKKNEYGLRSFDEKKIEEDSCKNKKMNYDEVKGECVEPENKEPTLKEEL